MFVLGKTFLRLIKSTRQYVGMYIGEYVGSMYVVTYVVSIWQTADITTRISTVDPELEKLGGWQKNFSSQVKRKQHSASKKNFKDSLFKQRVCESHIRIYKS
jgi:hypothetical protein